MCYSQVLCIIIIVIIFILLLLLFLNDLIRAMSCCSEATAITNSGYHTPSLKPCSDVAEQAAVHELALSDQPSYALPPISMFDLLEALQASTVKFVNSNPVK
jgi:hypothetical protein